MSIYIETVETEPGLQFDWIVPGHDEGVLYFQEVHYDGESAVTVAVLTATSDDEIAAIEAAITGVYPHDLTLGMLPEFVREAVEAAQ